LAELPIAIMDVRRTSAAAESSDLNEYWDARNRSRRERRGRKLCLTFVMQESSNMLNVLIATATAALVSSSTAALVSSSVADTGSTRPAACAVDASPARITQSVIPEVPPLAKIQDLHGTAIVRVDLSETGSIVGASIKKSAGSSLLDRAAIETVKAMTYAPETRECKATAGSYAVDVKFE
jgi:TonB family protein